MKYQMVGVVNVVGSDNGGSCIYFEVKSSKYSCLYITCYSHPIDTYIMLFESQVSIYQLVVGDNIPTSTEHCSKSNINGSEMQAGVGFMSMCTLNPIIKIIL